jgi:hypothetical protein
MRENPVERLWRELRVDRIWEGTSEIQRLVIANEIDKRGLRGLLDFTAEPAPAPPPRPRSSAPASGVCPRRLWGSPHPDTLGVSPGPEAAAGSVFRG